jgi:D-sedoheptulose 7-phosphate isomerase
MKFPNKNHTNLPEFLFGYTSEITKGFESIDLNQLKLIQEVMDTTIKNGHTIFSCGNGGSSAISDHFVCDFLKGTATDTKIQPIIHSFTSNTPTLTAVANDISYDDIFSFQLEKYATNQDLLICISSSGKSQNIIRAISQAKDMGVKTISFVGFTGGEAKEMSDYCIHINSNNYGIVEDVHQSLMHLLAQYIRLNNLDSSKSIEETIF